MVDVPLDQNLETSVPLGTPHFSCTTESQALVLTTRDSNAFVDVLGLGENLSMVFSTPDLQARVIATQRHIHHLTGELQLVYLNSLLDLLDGRLGARHVVLVKSITFLMVLFLKTFDCILQCTDDLVINWRYSSLLPDFRDFLCD